MKIKYHQGIAIMVLFSLANTVLEIANKGRHAYQGLIIAYLISFLLASIYTKILQKYSDTSFFKILTNSKFKLISKMVILIIMLILVVEINFVINNYLNFVTGVDLVSVKKNLLFFLIIILLSYFTKQTVKTFARTSVVLFIIIIIFLSLLGISSINLFSINNILPIIPVYVEDLMKNINYFLYRPFIESFFLLSFFLNLEKGKDKIFYKSHLITFIIFFILIIMCLGILGENFITSLKYPLFTSIGIIEVLDFLSRLESISVVIFLSTMLIKLYVYWYLFKDGLKKLFNKDAISHFLFVIILLVAMFMLNYVKINPDSTFYGTIIIGITVVVPTVLCFRKEGIK